MNKFGGIIIGLILLLVPIYDWITDFTGWSIGLAALDFLKGAVTWMLILMGAVLLLTSLSSLKD